MDAAILKLRGEAVAEAWYESEGGSVILMLHVLAKEPLAIADLLAAAGVPPEEVEAGTDLQQLAEPHATLHVRLKPPDPPPDEVPPETWQTLETAWKTILGLEATIDSCRLGMESLRLEMEAAFKRPLAVEEKLHALQNDVQQWTKAKSRVHHAVPKAREFIHRATFALAQPERKSLEEIFKTQVEPRVPFAGVDEFRTRLEHLQKDRQVLLAQGNTVNQECRGVLGEVQRAAGTLQRNAADNARRKRSASKEKGKHF
jgi:hypothetical protein